MKFLFLSSLYSSSLKKKKEKLLLVTIEQIILIDNLTVFRIIMYRIDIL